MQMAVCVPVDWRVHSEPGIECGSDFLPGA